MARHLGTKGEARPEGRQILLYGPPFSGKTTLLADPNLKVLMADMDHNTSPLDDADNVTIFPVDSYKDYLVFKEAVFRGYFEIDGEKVPVDADLIAFDSFTRFEELVKEYVIREFAPNRKRELTDKFGAQSDWQDLQDIEVREVRAWQAMTRSHGFNAMWIGHDMEVNNDLSKQVARIQLALQGKYASPRIMSAVDAVFYMHKEEKDGNIIRGIFTAQWNHVQADTRLPVAKREKLPKFVPNPELSRILPYLGWTKASN